MTTSGLEPRLRRVALGLGVGLVAARSWPQALDAWRAAEPRGAAPVLLALAGLVLAWRLRGRRETPIPGCAALALALAGVALHVAGARSGDASLVALALPPLALGAACLAWPGAGRAWPAALLVVAATPPPAALASTAVQQLKLNAASAASLLLSIAGTPAWHDAGAIRVPGGELRVIDACSGARTFVGLLVAAALLITLRPASARAKALTLAACLPAALVATTARLAVLAAAVDRHGPRSDAYRALHDAAGVMVVVPGVLMLLLASGAARALAPVSADDGPPAPATRARPALAWLAALALALALAATTLPSAPCPCAGPRALGARPAGGSEERAPAGRAGSIEGFESRSAILHACDLRARDGPHGAPPERAVPFCQATLAADEVHLADGTPVQRVHLARDDARRVAFALWLDARGRPVAASLAGAWTRAVLRGLRGESPGGTCVVLWTDDLGDAPFGQLDAETARALESAARSQQSAAMQRP